MISELRSERCPHCGCRSLERESASEETVLCDGQIYDCAIWVLRCEGCGAVADYWQGGQPFLQEVRPEPGYPAWDRRKQ